MLMKKILSKIFNKTTLKILFIAYALFSIVAVVYFADHLLCSGLNEDTGRLYLDTGWTVSINGEQYDNVDLSEFRFDAVDKGTIILMERTLPEDWDYTNPALTFHVRQCTVKMYHEWQVFYKYGHERFADNDTVGSGIQIVNISNDYKGETLRILLTVTENNAFSSLDSVYISEWSDAPRFVLRENRLALFTGSFLVVLGLVVSVVTIFATSYYKKYSNILWLSAFSIFMGFWTLCYHNTVIIFSIPTYSASLLEHMMLVLAPIPILAYMYTYVKQLQIKPVSVIYKLLFTLQIFASVMTIIFHATDLVHAAALLPVSQTLFLVHAVFFTFILLKNSQKNSRTKKMHVIGLVFILASILYDLIIYILNRYLGLHIEYIRGVASLGIIIFVGILVLDVIHDISLRLLEEHEKERLIKSAYTDSLTQINNRTFCAEYMMALDTKKSNNYTIINFDLNELKVINDSLGHAQGDHLLKTAATVISKAFSHSGIVGRMGGDEFIAIIPTADTVHIDKLIKRFNTLISIANDDDPYLHMSISYGYATNTELEGASVEEIYELADKRMYNYKRQYKKR